MKQKSCFYINRVFVGQARAFGNMENVEALYTSTFYIMFDQIPLLPIYYSYRDKYYKVWALVIFLGACIY